MNILESIYYQRSQKYLRLYGQWPYQEPWRRALHISLLMLSSASVCVPQSIRLYEIRHDGQLLLLGLPSMLFYAQWFFKNLFSFLKSAKIRNVLEKIQQDFKSFKDDELEILHEYSLRASKINLFYTVYMFMAVAAYSMLPLTLHTLDTFFPTNVSRLPEKPRLMRYYITLMDESNFMMIGHGIFVDMLAIVFIIGFDTLCFSLSYHVCALFVIVTKRLSASLPTSTESQENGSEIIEEQKIKIYNRIRDAIKMHNHALEYVDTIESAFSALNLLSIGCAMAPLTLTGFQVTMHRGNASEMFRFILFAVGEIIHLGYYNWPGQEIQDHSQLIYQTCYDSGWYRERVSKKCKILLHIMIVRSQKPCLLTAGKLYVLGLVNFAAIIKMSMSYFTVLSSIAQ